MKKTLQYIITSSLLALPVVSLAQGGSFAGGDPADSQLGVFIQNIVIFVNTILLPAVLAIAFFVFVWGIFRYFIAGGANEEARENGKNLMIYATLGFVFIVIFWGLVNFLAGTIGLEDGSLTTPNLIEIP